MEFSNPNHKNKKRKRIVNNEFDLTKFIVRSKYSFKPSIIHYIQKKFCTQQNFYLKVKENIESSNKQKLSISRKTSHNLERKKIFLFNENTVSSFTKEEASFSSEDVAYLIWEYIDLDEMIENADIDDLKDISFWQFMGFRKNEYLLHLHKRLVLTRQHATLYHRRARELDIRSITRYLITLGCSPLLFQEMLYYGISELIFLFIDQYDKLPKIRLDSHMFQNLGESNLTTHQALIEQDPLKLFHFIEMNNSYWNYQELNPHFIEGVLQFGSGDHFQ